MLFLIQLLTDNPDLAERWTDQVAHSTKKILGYSEKEKKRALEWPTFLVNIYYNDQLHFGDDKDRRFLTAVKCHYELTSTPPPKEHAAKLARLPDIECDFGKWPYWNYK